MRRGPTRVLVMVPNAALEVVRLALPNWVWFQVLNVSQRNCVLK